MPYAERQSPLVKELNHFICRPLGVEVDLPEEQHGLDLFIFPLLNTTCVPYIPIFFVNRIKLMFQTTPLDIITD